MIIIFELNFSQNYHVSTQYLYLTNMPRYELYGEMFLRPYKALLLAWNNLIPSIDE